MSGPHCLCHLYPGTYKGRLLFVDSYFQLPEIYWLEANQHILDLWFYFEKVSLQQLHWKLNVIGLLLYFASCLIFSYSNMLYLIAHQCKDEYLLDERDSDPYFLFYGMCCYEELKNMVTISVRIMFSPPWERDTMFSIPIAGNALCVCVCVFN